MAENPNRNTDEAIMPNPYFKEPCAISLNEPSMPMISPSQAMNCKAAGTHIEYLKFI